MKAADQSLSAVLDATADGLLDDWLREQLAAKTMRRDLLDEAELRRQSRQLLDEFAAALRSDGADPAAAGWDAVRGVLTSISRKRAEQGFTPDETATFVMSLKRPLFERIQRAATPDTVLRHVWDASTLLDQLALDTLRAFQSAREAVIRRQQAEILELSTPVVKLWDGVVAVPLIGTLDSERTQSVMESLLGQILEQNATVAIIDITGVPTVDTLVAQHLLKTVAAARLMGAECVVSGIRPQIAQTIVHLGVDLEGIVTRATMADAIQVALGRRGLQVAVRTS